MNSITTVLMVDDDEMNCKVLKRYFMTSNEIEVLSAHSADAALSIIADYNQKIDVVISDYRMPGIKGDALLERLSLLYPQITRILTSASNEEIDLILLKDRNVGTIQLFLEKPWDFCMLEQQIITQAAECP